VLFGPRLVEPPGEARSNFEVVNGLLRRFGVEHESVHMTDREMVAQTFARSGYPDLEAVAETGFAERAPADAVAHFADGFAWPDGRFRFAPNWAGAAAKKDYVWVCDPAEMPRFADYMAVNEPTDAVHPFRLATSPSRGFLYSTFSETPGSRRRQPGPTVFIHPADAAAAGVAEGDGVVLGNRRGRVELAAALFDGLPRGVLIAEGVFPNAAHRNGQGINTLIGSDPVSPFGGDAIHDAAVWLRRAQPLLSGTSPSGERSPRRRVSALLQR
jgi:anaerobic selenocysteine-containing dehydrogenase